MTSDQQPDSASTIWVVSHSTDNDVLGRLGDARELASRCLAKVAVLRFEAGMRVTPSPNTEQDESGNSVGRALLPVPSIANRVKEEDGQECPSYNRNASPTPGCGNALAESWIQHGADEVHVLTLPSENQSTSLDAAQSIWHEQAPLLVLTSADRIGRAWSARLAARTGWSLISPALLLQAKGRRLVATQLDSSGRRARQVELAVDQTAIVALRPGVAQPIPADATRRGTIRYHSSPVATVCPVLATEHVPPDPLRADIRFVQKLIAGGKGVGGREGFEILRRIAEKLGAGVAASRMAVDLGWIEADRQVGQTGKTVRPELYIACGISGASHHLEGMSDSGHIVAINTDPQAPLMQRAELAIQADLHQVLKQFAQLLEQSA